MIEYLQEKNNALNPVAIPGVPLANIDRPTWETMPTWIKQSICASDMYAVPEDWRDELDDITPSIAETQPMPAMTES